MISKELLDDVVAWEYKRETGYYSANDIYTLHFKQWWRSKLVLKYMRDVHNRNKDTKTFMHRMTPISEEFYTTLYNHIKSTYNESSEVDSKKCPVLTLVPNKDKEEITE